MRGDGFEPERDPTVGIVPEERGVPLIPPSPRPGLASRNHLRKSGKTFLFIFPPLSFSPLPLDVSLMPAARRAADSCGT